MFSSCGFFLWWRGGEDGKGGVMEKGIRGFGNVLEREFHPKKIKIKRSLEVEGIKVGGKGKKELERRGGRNEERKRRKRK